MIGVCSLAHFCVESHPIGAAVAGLPPRSTVCKDVEWFGEDDDDDDDESLCRQLAKGQRELVVTIVMQHYKTRSNTRGVKLARMETGKIFRFHSGVQSSSSGTQSSRLPFNTVRSRSAVCGISLFYSFEDFFPLHFTFRRLYFGQRGSVAAAVDLTTIQCSYSYYATVHFMDDGGFNDR